MQQYTDFISEHLHDDVRDLALRQDRYPDVDIQYAARQIAAWQVACKKLPLWAETAGIEYPVHLSMEQCSSQVTAEYKASIASGGETMTDLTAGFGVDATMMARKYEHLNYVERNAELCDIVGNNLELLGVKSYEVFNADGTELLGSLPHQSLIFLDPARRDEHGGKTVQISDCTPDVTAIQDVLLDKADEVMVKLSPMLNLSSVVQELKCVREIHVVSVDNECKEVLVVMRRDGEMTLRVVCANLRTNAEDEIFAYEPDSERMSECHYATKEDLGTYLYEPNASIMKAGCFRLLADTYDVRKLHPSSHLYTSDTLVRNFPGRTFKVETVCSIKDKSLRQLKKANLTVRNFPSTVAELRKKLKINEGGSDYLFATTLADESKVIIRGVKC